jgi:hypothetical protein
MIMNDGMDKYIEGSSYDLFYGSSLTFVSWTVENYENPQSNQSSYQDWNSGTFE